MSESPTSTSSDTMGLIERAALAMLRVDLGLLPPRVREEARKLLKASGDEFDGQRLAELCLEGRAADGPKTAERALNALRSRLLGHEMYTPRRRPSFLVRMTATATAKLVFFGIYTFLILVVVYLIKRNWEFLDLYELGDRALSYFKF